MKIFIYQKLKVDEKQLNKIKFRNLCLNYFY